MTIVHMTALIPTMMKAIALVSYDVKYYHLNIVCIYYINETADNVSTVLEQKHLW